MFARKTRPLFSVIIPTLQRANELHQLVTDCSAHPLVREVLVINNAQDPLSWDSPKVRVLQQEKNIYVNPAWNLGVRESNGEYLAILNDDISFNVNLFDLAASWLRIPGVGIIGPNRTSFQPSAGQPFLRPKNQRPYGWGTAMFMRKDAYTIIPERLRVIYGDDWLFLNSPRRNWTFSNIHVQTRMSVTSADPKFNPLLTEDELVWEALEKHSRFHRKFDQKISSMIRVLRK